MGAVAPIHTDMRHEGTEEVDSNTVHTRKIGLVALC